MATAAATVKRYLDELAAPKRRERPASEAAKLRARIERTQERLKTTTSVLARLQLHQQLVELHERARATEAPPATSLYDLEQAFIEVAAGWAARKGVSYDDLRSAGVPARVLRRAGIAP